MHCNDVCDLTYALIVIACTGVNGIQRNDSGLSRAESSGSGKPDPRAKPFVPPQTMTAKLKHGDGWSDTASGGSDGSALGGGQKPWAAVGKPSGVSQ